MCFAEKNPAAFKLTLGIDASSLVCRDKKRSTIAEFARNKDLAAKAFPEIRFTAHYTSASPVATSALGMSVKSFIARFRLDQSDPHLLPDLSAAVDIEPPQ